MESSSRKRMKSPSSSSSSSITHEPFESNIPKYIYTKDTKFIFVCFENLRKVLLKVDYTLITIIYCNNYSLHITMFCYKNQTKCLEGDGITKE